MRSPPQLLQSCRACIILSGGLDSSIVACLGKEILGFQSAFTVVTTPDSTDREHSVAVAAVAGLEHTLLDISLEDLLQELPDCVRLLQTFDGMELRNDIAGATRGVIAQYLILDGLHPGSVVARAAGS
jgi:asparagine synthetase B (glutamine-hydrolysing)